jgi:hypothetical protein
MADDISEKESPSSTSTLQSVPIETNGPQEDKSQLHSSSQPVSSPQHPVSTTLESRPPASLYEYKTPSWVPQNKIFQKLWDICSYTPPRCRYDPNKPFEFSWALNFLFAFAGTFTVANLYYSQWFIFAMLWDNPLRRPANTNQTIQFSIFSQNHSIFQMNAPLISQLWPKPAMRQVLFSSVHWEIC